MKTYSKILIDSRLGGTGNSGGVEQFNLSLIRSLSEIDDIHEKFYIFTDLQHEENYTNIIYKNNKFSILTKNNINKYIELLKSFLGPLRPFAGKTKKKIKLYLSGNKYNKCIENTFYGYIVDLIHFTTQNYVFTNIPSIYSPHDLQHLHYPEFFTNNQIRDREIIYDACKHANFIAVESNFSKNDIIDKFGINSDKIEVITWGSPTIYYQEPSDHMLDYVSNKYHIDKEFILYPAQTWQHKNHIRLIDAFYILTKDNNININLVCTGQKNDFWPQIEKQIHLRKLQNNVFFTGFIHENELKCLYRLAKFIIFPSLFEGGGFPILEAFSEGKPIACSNVTSIPEYAGEAALYFDPQNVDDIYSSMKILYDDNQLRDNLILLGSERIKKFSWSSAAERYLDLYRSILE